MNLAAVIVETRNLPNLEQIIRDHQRFLPNHKLFIFHGPQTTYLKNVFTDAEFEYLPEPFHLLQYNELLTSPSFWSKFLEYERVFIFQSDGMVLRPGIEMFYQWDFVGSPWGFQEHGGNGGESLRNPRVMLDICSKIKWDYSHGNCDVMYSNALHKDPSLGKLAPREVCMQWGVESIFALDTFCTHAIDKYLTPEQCHKIINQYKSKVL